MKINYSNTVEEYYLSEVRPGAVFFFVNEQYKNLKGDYEYASGPYMLGSIYLQGPVIIELDTGMVFTNVDEDSKVYFPKKVELNIEK